VSFTGGNSPITVHGATVIDESLHKFIAFLGSASVVNIGSTVETIGEYAFANDLTISRLTCAEPSSLRRIEARAFVSSTLKSISIPASVEFIDGSAFANCEIESFVVAEENRHFRVVGSFLLDFNHSRLVRYFGSDSEIVIPDFIQILGDSCFCANHILLTVRFESSSTLTTVGLAPFARATLHSITLPLSLTVLSGSAFVGSQIRCILSTDDRVRFPQDGDFLFDESWLTLIRYLAPARSVPIPPTLEVIGESAFDSIGTLSEVVIDPSSSLARIEANAFRNTSLKSIVIPASVEFIHGSAFDNCSVDSVVLSEANRHYRVTVTGKTPNFTPIPSESGAAS
jgi:hypothetical protein